MELHAVVGRWCFTAGYTHKHTRTEFISVGQKTSALDALETVIKSKRHRQWSPVLEDIVKKFLSLCTESQQHRRAREGLVQYRQITQQATQGPDRYSSINLKIRIDVVGARAVRSGHTASHLRF